MRVILDTPIDAEKLKELLNRVLNEYNISVYVASKRVGNKYVLHVNAELIKPVKYSPRFSQVYDYQSAGSLADPKQRFGALSKVLHWYHWALLNDTLTYMLDKLGVDYKIKSAAGTFKGWKEWRQQLNLPYDPEEDPAFLKRVAEPVKSVYGIKVYADRAKMLESLKDVEKKLRSGSVTPAIVEELEEAILEATKAAELYEGIHAPSSLGDHMPRIRAWMKLKYGEKAEDMLRFMTAEEVEEEYDELEEFLNSVDSKSPAFQRYLTLWIKELEEDIERAALNHGYFETVLMDKDDAGFPLELAKRLLKEPFKPNIDEAEIRRLLEKEAAEESESVSN